VAFASTGEYIDQHFGSARYFQVYDIDGSGYRHVETRNAKALCMGHCEGGFEHLFSALADCGAVFALKIGPSAIAFMNRRGKRVFEASGAVEEIIAELVKRKLLEESEDTLNERSRI
jgi:predicted Fe-Mo cluster-binding NifX family protein